MNRWRSWSAFALTAILAAILAACGGSSSDDGADPGINSDPDEITGNNNDVAEAPPVLGSVEAASDLRVVAGAFSPDGTRFAVSYRDATFTEVSVQVHDVPSGAVLATLPGTDTLIGELLGTHEGFDELYWAADGTLSGLGGFESADWLQWNPDSGELLQRAPAPDAGNECRTASKSNAVFDSVRNRLYSPARNSGAVCVWDMASQIVTAYPLGDGSAAPDVVALNASGDTLWVTFVDTAATLDYVATQPYDPDTLAPLSDASPSDDQAIVAASGGYHLLESDTLLTLDSLDRDLIGRIHSSGAIVAYRGSETVILVEEDGQSAILAVNAAGASYIGRVDVELSDQSVIGADGLRAALKSGEKYTFHDLSTGTSISALVPLPEDLPGVASGTINIDGVDQSITGTCDIFSDTVGVVSADIQAVLASGATFAVHAQNLLLAQTVTYSDSGVDYHASHLESTIDSTRVDPTITVSGSTISGTATVYDDAVPASSVTLIYEVSCSL